MCSLMLQVATVDLHQTDVHRMPLPDQLSGERAASARSLGFCSSPRGVVVQRKGLATAFLLDDGGNF